MRRLERGTRDPFDTGLESLPFEFAQGRTNALV